MNCEKAFRPTVPTRASRTRSEKLTVFPRRASTGKYGTKKSGTPADRAFPLYSSRALGGGSSGGISLRATRHRAGCGQGTGGGERAPRRTAPREPRLHSDRSVTRTGDEGDFERGGNARKEKHERNSKDSPQTPGALGALSSSGRTRTTIRCRNKRTSNSHKRRGRRSDTPNPPHESSKAKSPAQLQPIGLLGMQHSIETSVLHQTPDILTDQFPNPGNERLQPSTTINLYSINVIRRWQKGFPEE